ncbi:PAS domain S-box protein [Aureimonas phyllosphaerae]|uniref:PAS domain S-box protein n=1 Tax=Aureimonas phyllosphaerae TaxID=1166078 RepID=UPI003A5BB553
MQDPQQRIITDPARLAALDSLGILDTPAEQGFDDVAHLASRLCATPVALVSLVAADRQWFKAHVGFPDCQGELNSSICRYVLEEPDTLVIEDLATDPRTAANPLVTGEPHIRFYAGAPLRLEDRQVVGTLCVFDIAPRAGGLTADQKSDLRALSRQVSALLDMRRTVRSREETLDGQRIELRQARYVELLAKASEALLSASDPGAILEPILSANAEMLGFDRSYTYDIWPGSQHLRLTHSLNATAEVKDHLGRLPFGAPVCGIVADRLQPLILENMQAGSDPAFATARSLGFGVYAGFPIISRGILRGVISFASTQATAFDAEALSFFETLARMMSAVYERIDVGRALEETNERARLAQEAGSIGTFEIDIENGIARASSEACRIFGLPEAETHLARDFIDLVIPEDRSVAMTEATLREGSAPTEVEYRIRRAGDGALRWIARLGRFVRDEAGKTVRLFGTVQDITLRRMAQEALRANEERFRTIVNTVEAAFAIVEVAFDANDRPVNYRFVEANPAFERQAGVNLRGKWVTEFAPDLEQFWFETYGHVAKTGEPTSFENYAEAFERCFDVKAVRVGDPRDRQIAIFFSDVTARKKAEAALKASEALTRENIDRVQLALAAGAIIGTWNWDMIKDQFTIDEPFAEAFGLDPALGRKGIPLAQIVATVHPADQEGLAAAINEAVARGGAYAHQYRTRRADGNYYWLEANGRVDHAPDGTPTVFPGVLIDIEERRAVEAERDRANATLREREAFLSSVLASSNDCIKVLDLDAKLVFMSEGGKKVMEVSDFNAIVGCPWPDFWLGEGNLAAKEAIASAQAGVPSAFQGYADTMKGRRRYWDVQVSPIFGPDGKPERILSVSRDITALKASEEARTVLNQELSHRMKNLLAMVQAITAQTLRQATSMDEGREAVFTRISALARAQDILVRSSFDEADVGEIVEAAIAPHQTADKRIDADGPRVGLTAQQALGLSLAIHELATNAAKYGALSNEAGRVAMSWGEADGSFQFNWIESGGPLVTAPQRRGFGSKLIERIVASYFDGEGRIDFDPAGIRFTLIGAPSRAAHVA